jgi:hypothetical protein
MNDSTAIHLVRSKTGSTIVTAIGISIDAGELSADLRALDFVATTAGITLVAQGEEADAAVQLLRSWGYVVVVAIEGAL